MFVFVQVTVLTVVWRSRRADAPRCAHFPSDICSVIQEGACDNSRKARASRRVSASGAHALSLGRNKQHVVPYAQELKVERTEADRDYLLQHPELEAVLQFAFQVTTITNHHEV